MPLSSIQKGQTACVGKVAEFKYCRTFFEAEVLKVSSEFWGTRIFGLGKDLWREELRGSSPCTGIRIVH